MNSALLDAQLGGRLQRDPAALALAQADSFGSLPDFLDDLNPRRLTGAPSERIWRQLVAEELLLLAAMGRSFDERWRDEFGDEHPLGEEAGTLRELLAKSVWAAVVALSREDQSSGELARLWGVEGGAGGSDLEGGEKFRREHGCALYLVRNGREAVTGQSWQLGALLAGKFARDGRGDLLRRLARDWVVSGSDRFVIKLGNKRTIRTLRNWLIPATWEGELHGQERVHFCTDLPSGWRQVSGEGTQRLAERDWPGREEVVSLHCLVSRALRPILASILATRPRELHLWRSPHQFSPDPIAILLEVLKDERIRRWCGWSESYDGEPRLVSDKDLVSAEETLREAGLNRAESPGLTLMNITGGNTLMKVAAVQMARDNPQLWLIYREGSLKPDQFVRLHYPDPQGSSGLLRHAEDPQVDWNFLAKFPADLADDTVEFLRSHVFQD